MKLSRFRLVLIALACSAGLLRADIVVLKDGKRLEGSITAENPQSIHMRYKLTPKIWDDKDIPRTDIAEIIKQKPEEVELIELKKLFPTVDLMTAEKYEQLIQDRLRPFVNRYPGTKEAAEVEKLIAEVQEEKEKVVVGGVKMEGKWLSSDEAKANSYNITAYGMRAAMQEKVEAKDYPGALREFEKLYSMQGFASVYFPPTVEDAIALLTKYEASVEQMIKDQPALQKMREENTKKLIEPDLSRVQAAIKREEEQWKTTSEQERKSSKWFTPYKYDLAGLKTLSQTIVAEKVRLQELKLPVISKVNAAIARVMQSEPKASKSQDELKKMGEAILEGESAAVGADQSTQQFYASIFQGYRQRYAAAKEQLDAKLSQPTSPTGAVGAAGGSSAIAGAGTPGMDDKVAAALAAAAGGTPAAPTGVAPTASGVPAVVAPGAGVPTMPAGVAPGTPGAVPVTVAPMLGATAVPPGYAVPQPGMTPGVPVAGAPAGYPPQAGGYPTQPQPGYAQPNPGAVAPMAQMPAPTTAPAPAAETGEGTMNLDTNTLLMIGAGVVVLVLIVAMSGGKKKKKEG